MNNKRISLEYYKIISYVVNDFKSPVNFELFYELPYEYQHNLLYIHSCLIFPSKLSIDRDRDVTECLNMVLEEFRKNKEQDSSIIF